MARDEDDAAGPRPAPALGMNLETMSIAALEAYLEDLQAEIVRVQAMIASKRQARSGAEALFKR